MFYYYASIAYTFTNLVLACVVILKGRRSVVNQFYIFCILALTGFGFSAFILTQPVLQPLQAAMVSVVLFLFSLIPFFFLHFMVVFLRQYDILKSGKIIFVLYFAGLFSYSLVLKGLIPGPLSGDRVLSADGYIYYITWMSIFFSIGIALLFSLLEGFTEKTSKTNLLMTSFALLMLILPSPFTKTIYYSLFGRNIEWFGLTSAISLLIAIYLIFRYKIIATIYDAVKSALVVMNDVFILTNDKFEIELFRGGVGLLGYSEKTMFHRQLNDIIEQKHYIENYLAYVRNGKMKECLFGADVLCADGKKVVMDFSFSPVFEHDQIAGFVGIARDVTKRKVIEQALRTSEERFRRLTENAQDIIYRYNFLPSPRFEYISPVVAEITRYTPDEFYANSNLLLEIIHPDDRTVTEKYFQGEGDFDQMLTTRMLRKDGKLIWVEQRNRPIYDETGALIALEGIARDITERITLEEQLRQSQKLESIGTLAGGIAHDFNNILTIILGYSSILKSPKITPEKSIQYIDTIQKAVHRGTMMVRELLTIARKSDAELSPTNVNDLIQELIQLLRGTFPKTISISTNLHQDGIRIRADQNQLQQALLNVCVNARDAMPDGGELTIKTEISPYHTLAERFPNLDNHDYLCITVQDTGTGMTEEIRQRIFEPFFTTKDLGKGTGLGLAVVYSIVKSHHGYINVESDTNAGTTISMYFPIDSAVLKLEKDQPLIPEEFRRGSETVLLVEDEDLLLQLVRNMLVETGYHVLTAANGDEAIHVFQKHHKDIDVVLTDMGMPVIGGMELFESIKKVNPKVRTIFASGYFDPAHQDNLIKKGVRHFIQKPYQPIDILRVLREAIDAPEVS
ncbi:MAG: PAS domain S-box protein [Bacteroidota bacterium]